MLLSMWAAGSKQEDQMPRQAQILCRKVDSCQLLVELWRKMSTLYDYTSTVSGFGGACICLGSFWIRSYKAFLVRNNITSQETKHHPAPLLSMSSILWWVAEVSHECGDRRAPRRWFKGKRSAHGCKQWLVKKWARPITHFVVLVIFAPWFWDNATKHKDVFTAASCLMSLLPKNPIHQSTLSFSKAEMLLQHFFGFFFCIILHEILFSSRFCVFPFCLLFIPLSWDVSHGRELGGI